VPRGTAAAGPSFFQVENWALSSDGRVAIAVNPQSEMWITTDGRTWRDTGTELVVTPSGEHGQMQQFCIGAGRLVTIISVGKLTRAYYTDLLE
jgi:hypothetical protein